MKWTDKHGKAQRLKIIESVSCKWKDLGSLLGLTGPKLENAWLRFYNNTIDCCRHVFGEWIEMYDINSQYSVTWDGVYELLCDIDHSGTAKDLKECLESKGVSLSPDQSMS